MREAPTVVGHWAHEAIRHADYEQLDDGRWFARVPSCQGAVATGANREEAEHELFSVLQEWALLGMQLGDEIPVFGKANLNTEEARELTAHRA